MSKIFASRLKDLIVHLLLILIKFISLINSPFLPHNKIKGEKLEHVSNISNNLVAESKKFKWGAKKLSWQAMVNQYGPIVAMVVFVLFVLYMKFFW